MSAMGTSAFTIHFQITKILYFKCHFQISFDIKKSSLDRCVFSFWTLTATETLRAYIAHMILISDTFSIPLGVNIMSRTLYRMMFVIDFNYNETN